MQKPIRSFTLQINKFISINILIKPNLLAVAETERQPEAAIDIWVYVFKNGPSEVCGRQPLRNLKRYGLLKQTISLQIS